MIYSTELAIIATTVIGLGAAGFVVRRMIQHVDKRIHLMLRASYHNSRDIKENLETVDVVRIETRKALEHQRVLLSSLNQQIKNLESTIVGEKLVKHLDPLQEPTARKAVQEVVKRGIRKPTARKATRESLVRNNVRNASLKRARKEGLLGNLDDFLERGIEQIVANDVHPEEYSEPHSESVTGSFTELMAEPAIEIVEETQVAIKETVNNFEAEMAISPEEDVINFVEPEAEIEEVQKEVKRSVKKARRGGVISMENLLKQQQQQRSNQGEKTEKIVKLSSIFAHRGRVAHANDGAGRAKNVSVG